METGVNKVLLLVGRQDGCFEEVRRNPADGGVTGGIRSTWLGTRSWVVLLEETGPPLRQREGPLCRNPPSYVRLTRASRVGWHVLSDSCSMCDDILLQNVDQPSRYRKKEEGGGGGGGGGDSIITSAEKQSRLGAVLNAPQDGRRSFVVHHAGTQAAQGRSRRRSCMGPRITTLPRMAREKTLLVRNLDQVTELG